MCVANNFAQFFILCRAEMLTFYYLNVSVFPSCFLDLVSCLERCSLFQSLKSNHIFFCIDSLIVYSWIFAPSEIYIVITGKEEVNFILSQISQDFNTFQTWIKWMYFIVKIRTFSFQPLKSTRLWKSEMLTKPPADHYYLCLSSYKPMTETCPPP